MSRSRSPQPSSRRTQAVLTPAETPEQAASRSSIRATQDYLDGQFVPTFPSGVIIGDPTQPDGGVSPILTNIPPPPPTGLTATAGANEYGNYFDVSWTAPTGDGADNVASYELQFKKSSATTWLTVRTMLVEVRVAPIEPDVNYDFRVRSVSWRGLPGNYTATTTTGAGHDTTAPGQITNLALTAGIKLLLATWDASTAADIKHYRVQIDGTSNAFGALVHDEFVDATVVSYDDLDGDHQYWVRVAAVDKSGNQGTYSTTATATTLLVDTGDVGPGSITTTEIADDAITTPKLIAGAVTAAKITAGTITSNEIAANTIVAGNIAAATITGAKIAAGTITASNITAGTITATELAANSITAAKLSAVNIEAGKYVRSTSYVTGVSGWSIDADGSAEFNNVTVRGTVEASSLEANTLAASGDELQTNGGAETSTTPAELVPNGTFDADITGWTGSNATLARITSSPAPQAGAGSMRLTANSAATMYAESATGLSGIAVSPGSQYLMSAYFRTLVTARSCAIAIKFYDSTGAALADATDGLQNDATTITDASGAWTQQSVYVTPPPFAAFASIRLYVLSPANGEQHAVDSISFQKQTTAWGSARIASGQTGNTVVTRDTGTKRTGAASWKSVIPNVSGSFALVLATSISVTGGAAYEVEGYFQAVGAGQVLVPYVRWYADKDNLAVGLPPPSMRFSIQTSSFSRVRYAVQVPADATRVTIGFQGISRSDGTAIQANDGWYADDITIVRSTLIDGGYINGIFVKSQTTVEDGLGQVFPIGGIIPWAGTTEPGGWFACNGQAISRSANSRLFAVIGTTYGTGDGSTTFNVPDLRGRTPVGMDNMLGGGDAGRLAATNTLGGSGGEETHALITAELPSHTHPASSAGVILDDNGANATADLTTGGGNYNRSPATGATGSGTAHNNMQPYLFLNYLIKC